MDKHCHIILSVIADSSRTIDIRGLISQIDRYYWDDFANQHHLITICISELFHEEYLRYVEVVEPNGFTWKAYKVTEKGIAWIEANN